MTSVFLVGYEVTSEVRFSYVSPDFDHAFRCIIIKAAVVPPDVVIAEWIHRLR